MWRTSLLLVLLVGVAVGLPHLPRLSDGPRIVGGLEATPGEFPWQISLQERGLIGPAYDHSCGGSIISDTHVVTAGHCLDRLNLADSRIVAGVHDLNSFTADTQERGILVVTQHEHYDGNTYTNDIGIIKVDSPFLFSANVTAIPLPTQMDLVAPGTNCTTTGWGTTVEGGSLSNVLRKVDIPVVSDADCRASYGITSIADHMLCAGLPEGGKDACQGDSGGPFVCAGTLHGITSWGNGCARPTYPGVWTEVAYFRDWIDANMV